MSSQLAGYVLGHIPHSRFYSGDGAAELETFLCTECHKEYHIKRGEPQGAICSRAIPPEFDEAGQVCTVSYFSRYTGRLETANSVDAIPQSEWDEMPDEFRCRINRFFRQHRRQWF